MKKEYFYLILLLFLFNRSYAELDESDKIPNNVKSIGASGLFYMHFDKVNNGFDLNVIHIEGSFNYEKYFKEKWSFTTNPTIAFNINMSYSDFNIGTITGLRRYFNRRNNIPYISFGIYSLYWLTDFDDPEHTVVLMPSMAVGFIKEIKDDFYFDIAIGIPTIARLQFGSNGFDGGWADINIPIRFGFKKYIGFKKE